MNNKNEKRHHIAKTYLEGFRKNGLPIYMYNNQSKEICTVSTTSDFFSQVYFYTNDTEEFLSKHEAKFSKYKNITTEKLFESTIKNNINEFPLIISIFFYRSQYQKKLWSSISDVIIENKIPLPLKTEDSPILHMFNNFSSKPIYLTPPEEKDDIWNEIEQDTFEDPIINLNSNKIIEFITKSISLNKYKIITANDMFTSENPVIVLDKNNIPIKFNPDKIETLIFTVNDSIRICFYDNQYIPIPDYFELFVELLNNNYCNYLIFSNKINLINKLNKYDLKYIGNR